MMSFIMWMTGRPCSGKTTIARQLEKSIPNLAVLDGNELYKWLGTYEFSREARIAQNKRVAHLAKLLMKNGELLKEGEILTQKQLGKTFSRLIEIERKYKNEGRVKAIRKTRDYFYKGEKLSRDKKIKIKSIEGIDDFAMMREVVNRRYTKAVEDNRALPDLILIDGGKGQLSAAKSALDSLGLGYLPVIGLAKRLEEVFKPGLSEPQNIPKTSPGLHLLRAIRDEVHRFAITFHRKSRKKDMTKSIFEEIPGMGKKRIQKLWQEFESLEAIEKSSLKEIVGRTGFSKKLSSAILECAGRKA